MYCRKCGSELRDDDVFCPYCGEKFSDNNTMNKNKDYDLAKGMPMYSPRYKHVEEAVFEPKDTKTTINPSTKSSAVLSFVFAILSLVFMTAFIGVIFGFGAINGSRKILKDSKLAKAAFIIGVIGFSFSVVFSSLLIANWANLI